MMSASIYNLLANKLFKKGQNLICCYCINQPKNTGALTSDRGYGGIYGVLTMNDSPVTGKIAKFNTSLMLNSPPYPGGRGVGVSID